MVSFDLICFTIGRYEYKTNKGYFDLKLIKSQTQINSLQLSFSLRIELSRGFRVQLGHGGGARA